MKKKFIIACLSAMSLLFLVSCGGGGGGGGGNNATGTVTITGTLATANLNVAKIKGIIKQASQPSDFKLMAISGTASGSKLAQSIGEATISADGTFTISDLPDGATAIAVIDSSGDDHKLVGLMKFGEYGVIDTSSTSASDTIDLGTITYDGSTGFATASNDAALDSIKDTTTTVAETVIIDKFGSTGSAAIAGGTETDSDADTKENDLDFDRDGDGVADALDRDGNGNGVLNQIEGDKFSTCRYFQPNAFINNKIPIGSTDPDQYTLAVDAMLTDEAKDLTVSSIKITSPAYILSETQIQGSPSNCDTAGEDNPNEFTDFDGNLLDATASAFNKFCGFISSKGEATTMMDNADSGDMYVFEMTATDSSGAAVTETCTMQLSYVLKTIPQNITIDGAAATPNVVNLPDNDFTIAWTTLAGIPDGFSYRFDVTPTRNDCSPLPGVSMKFPQSASWVVPTTESITISLADADLTSPTTFDDKFPDFTGATNPADFADCWQFDLTIQDRMNDNSSQSVMVVCRAGGNCVR